MRIIKFIAALSFLFLIASCGSSKKIAYLQDVTQENYAITNLYTNVIKPGDVLVIAVTSSKPELAAPYNLYSIKSQLAPSTQRTTMSSSGYVDATRQETEGYLVDPEGYIEFPGLGMINLKGKTRLEAANVIQKSLMPFVPDPIVTVTFINFKVTVLGEVNRPGTYNVVMDRISIFDALGMAGDMTVYGDRTNILVIREEAGNREIVRLNIKSKDIFNSDFFYLQQNDVVVVDPVNAKARTLSPLVQNVPLFVSLGSLLTTIAIAFFR